MASCSRSPIAFQFSSFKDFPIISGMSGQDPDTPASGDMAHAPGTNADEIEENRQRFLGALGLDPRALTMGRQTHGAGVVVVEAGDRGRGRYPTFDGFPETDGLITRTPGIVLGTIIADCTPILLYDPVQHVLGLVHAGWRGTVAGIAGVAVRAMTTTFGVRPEDLRVGIGPSIGSCCYEVGDEVIDAWRGAGFPDWEQAVTRRQPRAHFDLWQANTIALMDAGVPEANTELAGHCTRCCESRYFSHRAAMAGERIRGRMIMVAQLLDQT